MSLYNLADLLDKTMIAQRKSVSRKLPEDTSTIVDTYDKGDTIGKVFSWVKRGSDTWLQFYDSSGKTYYFNLSQKGVIDKGALDEQGVQTVQEKADAEAEANKDTFSRIYDGLLNLVLFVLGAWIIKSFIDKKA